MSKAYAGVPALSGVTLRLTAGRVHALMGENGAGKSTLIKLAAGVVRADRLTVFKDDRVLPLTCPQEAHAAGFRFIHQESNIVPQVSVAENILLGRRYPRRFALAVDWARLHQRAQCALDALGAPHIDVRALAGTLPAGDRLLIRTAAALVPDDGSRAELYVFDEPTAALTSAESERLFAVIDRLKRQGAAILYVSHRLDEVLRICDEVTVLRDGRRISTGAIADTDRSSIVQAMTGREMRSVYPPRDSPIAESLRACVRQGRTARLHGLDFELRAGEVLGVCGLAEAGQSELLRLFMGLQPLLDGEASVDGGPLPAHPVAAWARQIAYVPGERRSQSLMLDLSVRSNIMLPHLGDHGWRASKRAEQRRTRASGEQVSLKHRSVEQPVGQLSGGNQQKVVFARALCGSPRLLLLDEPTRGVDVGAKHDIYRLLRRLSASGCAVLLGSSELPEVLGLCDRILVLQDGRQAHLLDAGNVSAAELLAHFHPGADTAGSDG